jgi:soluble lytic murein transglycosylase-like protein
LHAATALLVYLASSSVHAFMNGIVVDDDIRGAISSREPAALVHHGARLEHGESVPQSADGPISLYCIAARAGDAKAQYALGWMYANGRGVTRNDALAAAWFQLAARARDPHAERMLRRLGVRDDTPARCLLSAGEEVLPPLRTVLNPSRALIVYWVKQLAPRAGLDPNLVLSVIEVESAFNPRAQSPKKARGLMQLIAPTARRFGTRNVWDPLDNIRGGIAYMEWLRERFKGDMSLLLAGYNAGEGAVQKYRGIPPYKETQAYVKSVGRICRRAAAGKHSFVRNKKTVAPALAKGLALVEPASKLDAGLASCPAKT